MEETVSSTSNITNDLTNKDMVVKWGGTRDNGRNEANQALKQIKNFVQSHSKTNIVALSAPCRYDLVQTSCVNEVVKVFNQKLGKHLKVFSNAHYVEVDSNRDFYTRHGLHLNLKGKEHMARKTAMTITDVLKMKKCDPIILRDKYHLDTITKRDQFKTNDPH
jgi:hypothetical protein